MAATAVEQELAKLMNPLYNCIVTDSTNSVPWSPFYGGARIDKDSIQYFHKIYCKDCRMESERKERERQQQLQQQGTSPGPQQVMSPSQPAASPTGQPTSPQSSLEEMSLQQTMDKNKESLKRKLMLRRNLSELVDQGIYPPLKTPPAFAEQRKQLERAKTGDLLRHKIQSRPARESLVQQHILEDSTIDPSLQDRQRQLKRARLVDDLNEKLAHRPGPLELVEGNIIQTDGNLVDKLKVFSDTDVQESCQIFSDEYGSIMFHKTVLDDEGQRFIFDDDSNTSDGAPSPQQGDESDSSSQTTPHSAGTFSIPSPPDISPLLQKIQSSGGATFNFTGPPITTSSFSVSNTSTTAMSGSSGSKNGSSSSKNKKNKSKPKPTSKSKVIKFHEYKGPPNIVKTQQPPQANVNSETPYHILLQQQQLFLQWQLEFQQRNLPLLLPSKQTLDASAQQAAQSGSALSPSATVTQQQLQEFAQQQQAQQLRVQSTPSPQPVQLQQTQPSVQQSVPQPTPQPQQNEQKANTTPAVPKLEDLKVADLKAECKKRNLPVSGPKPNLINRLKPYADSILAGQSSASTSSSTTNEITLPSLQNVGTIINVQSGLPQTQQSVTPMDESTGISPPETPDHMTEIKSFPMSPETMDTISSPPTILVGAPALKKGMTAISQPVMPMLVEQISRPPSAAPSDPMDIDLNSSFNGPPSIDSQVSSVSSIASSASALQQQLNHDELLRQQQRQIQELQRQLQESQRKLQQHHGTQQPTVQTAQQQPLSPPRPGTNLQAQIAASSAAQSVALSQSLPAAIVTQANTAQQQVVPSITFTSTTVTQPSETKPRLTFLPSTALHESLNLNGPKVFQFATAPPNGQPFVFTSKPDSKKSPGGGKSPKSSPSSKLPVNGINRTQSMPNSPISNTNKKSAVSRTMTSPFFQSSSQNSIPLKEPPAYDEAMKNRQNSSPGETKINLPASIIKSQAMDDVLDILIRSGELPPSAAQEPPPTPKTMTQSASMPSISVAVASGSQSAVTSLPSNSAIIFSPGSAFLLTPNRSTVAVTTTSTVLTNGPARTSVPSPVSGGKKTPPAPLKLSPTISNNNCPDPNSINTGDLVNELSEHLDFPSMDWTGADADLDNLELPEGLSYESKPTLVLPDSHLLSVPGSSHADNTHSSQSLHGSEPNLAALGINDNDDENSNMNIDVSDWLDVIMPSTGLTPLSANAPVSFPSDPILTPKPQDVMELFNLEESDFNTPTGLESGMNWDKLVETSNSSSA